MFLVLSVTRPFCYLFLTSLYSYCIAYMLLVALCYFPCNFPPIDILCKLHRFRLFIFFSYSKILLYPWLVSNKRILSPCRFLDCDHAGFCVACHLSSFKKTYTFHWSAYGNGWYESVNIKVHHKNCIYIYMFTFCIDDIGLLLSSSVFKI